MYKILVYGHTKHSESKGVGDQEFQRRKMTCSNFKNVHLFSVAASTKQRTDRETEVKEKKHMGITYGSQLSKFRFVFSLSSF